MESQERRSKLDTLTPAERTELIERLHKAQNGLCYVDQEVINLQVHEVDIDHIELDPKNWTGQ